MASEKSGMRLIVSHYWRELKDYPHIFIPLLLLVPVGVFLNNFAMPLIASQIIDTLSQRGQIPANEVWDVFGTLIILFIGAAIFGELLAWRFVVWIGWRLEMRVVYRLYLRCFAYLSGQSAQFHADRFGGSLVSQTNKFTSSYIRLSDSVVFQVLPFVSSLVFTFVILGPRVPLFTAIMGLVCVLFIAVNLTSYHRIRHLNETESKRNNKLSGHIADMITNVLTVKSFSSERKELDRFERLNKKAIDSTRNVMRATLKRDIGFGSALSILMISMLLFIVYGQATLELTIGTMVLMLTYSVSLFGRLWDVMFITRSYNRIYGDALPMAEVLQTDIVVRDPDNPEPARIKDGAIEFNEVHFTHQDSDASQKLFESFDLGIKPGEKIGLIGRSGSGKTTLTKLLLRFMDVGKGSISIDGQDIRNITQMDLRQHIAYVPQEPMLFHRSLHENIAYGRPKAKKNEVREAAEKAFAAEFIEKLPQGYNTLVGERGVKLSGGQRQRIAIARAILKDAPILVLDEATSALDSESEKLIQKALWELMKGRTAIVIAHRLSTIQRMDRIVVLENGRIAEQGSHAELLKNKGIYYDLWSHQSGGFIEE